MSMNVFVLEESKRQLYLKAFADATKIDSFGKCISLAFRAEVESCAVFVVATLQQQAGLYKFMRTFAKCVENTVGTVLPLYTIVCTDPSPYAVLTVDGMTPALAEAYNLCIAAANVTFMEETGHAHPNIRVIGKI